MIISEVKYGYTFNKGQYESERIDLSASPEDGETPEQVLEVLKAIIHGKPYSKPVAVAPAPPVVSEAKDEEEDKQLKFDFDSPKPVAQTSKDTEEKRGPGRPPTKSKSKKEAEKAERVVAVMEKVIAQAEPEVVTQAEPEQPKKVKFTGSVYNRELDLHKKLVGEFLNKNFPNWRSDIAKAKNASVTMNGKEFLSAEGLVLETFKQEFAELMK
jgi:hypothetical protein